MSKSKNDPEMAAADSNADWQKIAADLAGALNSCITQIGQMRGLFDDTDGTIQEALNEAEEAVDAYHSHRQKQQFGSKHGIPSIAKRTRRKFRKPSE